MSDKSYPEGVTGPALIVSITVMRNMLAGCQIIVGKGLTDAEIGDAEAAALKALTEEIYDKERAGLVARHADGGEQ